ncbi:MAG: uroporphyrinogen decarboxylase family protein [Clostridia bacterium]|nr:uroporphyrinogen decarboxylase family protein [Clostridia bacterium]
MNGNMKQWLAEQIHTGYKKPLPLLSFPCVQMMGISVRELISDSSLQAKGMALVAQRVNAAAAVSLMDLSVEAEAFGANIHVRDDEVPTVVGALLADEDDAKALQIPPVGSARTGIYLEAIEKATKLITDRPVFAGVIGPFSLAGRLMDISEAMILCYEEPDMVKLTLEKCTAFLIEYIKAYKKAGANGVAMAEPAAGLLSPALCQEFSCDYIRTIVDAVQDDDFVVIYHNCGNAIGQQVEQILSTGCAAYHFGNAVPMVQMLQQIPGDVLTMGNVDPAGVLRGGNPQTVREETVGIMEACCQYPNFLISSGCDIPPATPWENLDAFFAAAEEFYHQ